MPRLLTIESRRATHRLALALLCISCGCRRTDEPVAAPAPDANVPEPSGKAPAPSGEAPEVADDAPTVDAPPEGWSRLLLSTVEPGLTGTIDLPPGITAQAIEGQEIDADGLEAEAHHVQVGPRAGGMSLETMAEIPPRFASAATMAAFHGQFEVVSTHALGPDHWAVVQRWRPAECMMHGWSAAAGLSCDVFNAPCDQIEEWVRICGTLRAGPTPNHSSTTPTSAFPRLEPAAAVLATTVARAVTRNDASLLLGALGPKGVKIRKKQHTAKSLEATLAGRSVLQVVAPIFHEMWDGTNEGLFGWNGDGSGDTAKVWFSTGYGRQPYFIVKKTGEEWHVVEFGVYDLGEP